MILVELHITKCRINRSLNHVCYVTDCKVSLTCTVTVMHAFKIHGIIAELVTEQHILLRIQMFDIMARFFILARNKPRQYK